MNKITHVHWINICLFNLLIVAALGVLMRYKIGFEFPHFSQNNLHFAHSHFAFSGWITLLLMALMVNIVKDQLSGMLINKFNKIFLVYLFSSYGMLVAFAIQGYGFYSIVFSTLSVITSFFFCYLFYKVIIDLNNFESRNWFIASLFFNIISAAGTFYLIYMMASKHIVQHAYLASVYWYLHFQYNGWFFFACMGLFFQFIQSKNITVISNKNIFRLFAFSCIPAYGLSVLWLKLPVWLLIIIAIAALCQFYAWVKLLIQIKSSKSITGFNLNTLGKLLLLFVAIALTVKLTLQLGSTIPAINKLAFGFRPIVIAYLHLVLLACISTFLITYIYIGRLLIFTSVARLGIIVFVIGVLLNELVLAVQGIASFSYTMIPYVNESLFIIAGFIFIALIMINTSKLHKSH